VRRERENEDGDEIGDDEGNDRRDVDLDLVGGDEHEQGDNGKRRRDGRCRGVVEGIVDLIPHAILLPCGIAFRSCRPIVTIASSPDCPKRNPECPRFGYAAVMPRLRPLPNVPGLSDAKSRSLDRSRNRAYSSIRAPVVAPSTPQVNTRGS